jgi:two-component SAPR family response regulator
MTMTAASFVDLAGRRVLVVEDHFLIALDMEVMLRALGARAIDLSSSIGAALAAIERRQPDFAILDFKLGAKMTALPIAEVLQGRSVPFVFVTGYDDFTAVPVSMRNAPVVRKPVPFDALRTALATLALR